MEILFRGKRLDNGEWVCGYHVKNKSGVSLIFTGNSGYGFSPILHWEYHEVDPKTVGQYTGLKDRDGAKIFEGDIVVAFKGEDCEEVNAVFYNANHCKWFLGSPHNNKLPMGLGEFCWLDLEVIGTHWDNPELLEVE